ncbi:Fic/DOC family protein [Ponticaulis profundi]|uniref:protein adenylyltransferase n=1 Tax=Ponticaulis profundi TaxID=2665222 RepID=A0ABW1SCV2_9PROT
MNNEAKDRCLYRWPGSDVLRNQLGLEDAALLEYAERRLVQQRMEEGCPNGSFDLDHLKAIHQHLFQDVYDWAGEIRQVDINKGGLWFHPHDRIEMGMADIHKRLEQQNFLRALGRASFATEASVIVGDLNALHPFREGNGRTQLHYLSQLASQAGQRLDLTKLERGSWIQASILSHEGDYRGMSECISRALGQSRTKDRSR